MWRKIGNIVGVLLAFGLIVAYICCASYFARKHRNEQRVQNLVIAVEDESSMGSFTSSSYISQQLQQANVKIEDKPINEVDLSAIIKTIAKNSFVKDVDAYVTYSGEAYVSIEQYKPILRLLCGGMNSYVTSDGYIFGSPQGGAYYTSVVTGCYKPMFPPTYNGSIADYYGDLIAKEDSLSTALKSEYSALKRSCRRVKEERAEYKKQSRRKKYLGFESDEDFENRKKLLEINIAKCNAKLANLAKEETKLKKRQLVVENRKKKLQKSCEDFMNLINFVSLVNEHSFWSAEVVQIEANKNSLGEITLRLVPRSGDFVVEFGTLADSSNKLEKLQQFYDRGLSHIGWDEYRVVDVRYEKQVICTK